MGCWNKTCGLSNLHIRAGDPVYVFILENRAEDRSLCYSTAFFSPLLLPFNSEYDDYGGGENSSGPAFELIMNAIKEGLVEVEPGENKYHDIAVKKDGFNERTFFEAVHEGRLQVKLNRLHSGSNLQFVMFRKDIVDSILDNWQREDYVGDGKGTCGWNNNYIRYGFKDIIADLPEFLDRLQAYIGDDKEKALGLRFFGGFESVFEWSDPNKVGKWIRGDEHRYSQLICIKNLVIDMLSTDQRDQLEPILVEYLKGRYIDGFMHMTRKSWMPGGHEGSQSQEHHGYRVLMAAMDQALLQEKQEYEKNNSEEFSEF